VELEVVEVVEVLVVVNRYMGRAATRRRSRPHPRPGDPDRMTGHRGLESNSAAAWFEKSAQSRSEPCAAALEGNRNARTMPSGIKGIQLNRSTLLSSVLLIPSVLL
jgi:hypothetical protein